MKGRTDSSAIVLLKGKIEKSTERHRMVDMDKYLGEEKSLAEI